MRFLSFISLTLLAVTTCFVLAAPIAYSSSLASSVDFSDVTIFDYESAIRAVEQNNAYASTSQLTRVGLKAMTGDERSVLAYNRAMELYDPKEHGGKKAVLKKSWQLFTGGKGYPVKLKPKPTKAQLKGSIHA